MKKEIIVTPENLIEVKDQIASFLPKNSKVIVRNAYVDNYEDALSLFRKHKSYEGCVIEDSVILLSVQFSNFFQKDSVNVRHQSHLRYISFVVLKGSHPCPLIISPPDKVTFLPEGLLVMKNGTDSISQKKPYIQGIQFS